MLKHDKSNIKAKGNGKGNTDFELNTLREFSRWNILKIETRSDNLHIS